MERFDLSDTAGHSELLAGGPGHTQLLLRLGDILLSATSLQDFCEELLDALTEATGAFAGVLFLADPAGTIAPFCHVGLVSPEMLNTFSAEGGLAVLASRSGSVIIVDGDDCARFLPRGEAAPLPSEVRGLCATALRTDARLVGVLVLATAEPSGFGLVAGDIMETIHPVRLAKSIEMVSAMNLAAIEGERADARVNASRLLMSTADADERVGLVAGQIAGVAGVSRCFIFEVTDDRQEMVAASGATERQSEDVRRGLEGPIETAGLGIERIVEVRQPNVISRNDVLDGREFAEEADMLSVLVVPLIYGGRVTGLAYVDEPGVSSTFTASQLDALDAVTDVAALGTHSAQIQKGIAEKAATERHRDRLSALHHILNQIRIYLEEAELLETLPRIIADGLDYDRVYVYLVNNGQFELACGHFRRHEKEYERFAACARRHPPLIGEPSIEVEVYRHGAAQLVSDPSSDSRVKKQHQKLLKSSSAAVVPLWGTKSVLGVLVADYKYQGGTVSDEDIGLLSLLGTGIGTTLENVRLYEAARRDRDKLATLLENSDDAIVIVNRDRNIVAFNKASERLSGVSSEDAIGKNCQEVWRCQDEQGRDLAAQMCPVATRIAGLGRDKATYTEHVVVTQDGREVDVASTYAYVEGPDGAVEQGMEILRDLTEHKRWLRERHIANTLQKALLPEIPQSDLGIDVGVHYESATLQAAVGGDFYDFVQLDNGLFGIVIGDVCGKGIDAAHHAAMTKFTLRAYLLEGAPPATVMARLNDAIHAQVRPGEFISMCFGLLDPAKRTFTYANAGHPRPLLRHGSEGWRSLDTSGIVLGVAPRQTYGEETVQLGPEDVLLFYTDGLVETRRGPTVFGEERLHQFLSRCRLTDAQQFAERIYQRSATFSGGNLIDDVAVVVVRL